MYESTFSLYSEKLKQVLNQPTCSFAEATSKQVPAVLGVYVIYDDRYKKIIFAGRSKNLRRRLLQQSIIEATLEAAKSEKHWDKNII